MNLTPALANATWWLANLPTYARFKSAILKPAVQQNRILQKYIQHNAGTEFGREHHFAEIDSVKKFQNRVPIRRYDELTPWIDRIVEGRQNVLTSDPVIRLVPSSGSTRGRKLIPYTRRLQSEFNNAIGPWIVDLFRSDPSLASGCAYWSISPVTTADSTVAGTTPIGFEEDSAYLGGVFKPLVDAVMAVPGDVRFIRDIVAFRYVTLLLLLRRPDLRIISVWHPSFLDLLLDAARNNWIALINDIRHGTISPPTPIDPSIALRLRRRLHPDVRRADTLEKTGPDCWSQIWPRLGMISCWGDAHAAASAHALSARLPGVRMQHKGLLATEAFVTIPFANARPLAITSHFFEFLGSDGTIHLADDLERGAIYSIVITTASGLYRYRLGDQVAIDGFVGKTPSLRLVGRDDHVADRFGEKLSEGFVGQAIRNTLARLGVSATFSMLAPTTGPDGFRYTLFIESQTTQLHDLASELDTELRGNLHYDHCRNLWQILQPAVFLIRGNAFVRYCEALDQSKLRLGDIKPSGLSNIEEWQSVFEGEYISQRQLRAEPSGFTC